MDENIKIKSAKEMAHRSENVKAAKLRSLEYEITRAFEGTLLEIEKFIEKRADEGERSAIFKFRNRDCGMGKVEFTHWNEIGKRLIETLRNNGYMVQFSDDGTRIVEIQSGITVEW